MRFRCSLYKTLKSDTKYLISRQVIVSKGSCFLGRDGIVNIMSSSHGCLHTQWLCNRKESCEIEIHNLFINVKWKYRVYWSWSARGIVYVNRDLIDTVVMVPVGVWNYGEYIIIVSLLNGCMTYSRKRIILLVVKTVNCFSRDGRWLM